MDTLTKPNVEPVGPLLPIASPASEPTIRAADQQAERPDQLRDQADAPDPTAPFPGYVPCLIHAF
jgi:hypothetical protein